MYVEQVSTSVIAVTQASCEPVLQSSTEQGGGVTFYQDIKQQVFQLDVSVGNAELVAELQRPQQAAGKISTLSPRTSLGVEARTCS